MAKKKSRSKQKDSSDRTAEIAGQLEHVFLAGLGALANTQKVGSKAFETLVKQGESFRKGATDKTETLIDDVQDAIRGMADDAQDRATGLIEQMRGTPKMDKLQSVFDSRIDSALDRLGVASKHDLDKLNSKLNRVLKSVGAEKKTAKKPAKKVAKKVAKKAPVKKAVKKTAVKKTSTKKVAKKAAVKKAPVKKAVVKKAPAKKAPATKAAATNVSKEPSKAVSSVNTLD
jgi:poly(hydroxyalkanoate) granule-associated protein